MPVHVNLMVCCNLQLILGGAVLILSVDNYDEGQVLVTLFSESLVTVYQTDPPPHYDWT